MKSQFAISSKTLILILEMYRKVMNLNLLSNCFIHQICDDL